MRHLGCECIVLPNRSRIPIEDAVCILLHRMAFPIRLEEMEIKFCRCHIVLSRTINYMVRFILDRFGHLLCLDRGYVTAAAARVFMRAISIAGSPLPCCIGFIDGTVRAMCLPGENQRPYFNGHKRLHALKFPGSGLELHPFSDFVAI